MHDGHKPQAGNGPDFSAKPVLVFWETTRACSLSCRHCRASAIPEPLPGELTTSEGRRLIEQVAAFGNPPPVMILTGGDPMLRRDLPELMQYAHSLGVRFAVSPAATDRLTSGAISGLKEAGATSISVSLDGSSKEMHDKIRGTEGAFERTLRIISSAISAGLEIQVNTTVMKDNLSQLADIFLIIKGLGIKVWEVFFLVRVGRGTGVADLDPSECESACNFLYDASMHGMVVRTVEAPFIRRVARTRKEKGDYWKAPEYLELHSRLVASCGQVHAAPTISPRGTLDGDGIIFVSYEGTIYPGGFLPMGLGNVRSADIVKTYREDDTLKSIRSRSFEGPCGSCDFRYACGGSRSRAYASTGNPLSSDPACLFGNTMYLGRE